MAKIEFNPKVQYGNYVQVSGHGHKPDDVISQNVWQIIDEHLKELIPEKFLKDIKIKRSIKEAWINEETEEIEYCPIPGAILKPITMFWWKTIPEK